MRVIDVELENILTEMNDDELSKFWDLANNPVKNSSDSRAGINYYYYTKDIQKILGEIGRPELASQIDDNKAIEDIQDEKEKESARFSQGMGSKPIRRIPEDTMKSLIRRARAMNPGAKFAEQYVGKSVDEIDFKMDLFKSSEELHKIDPQYGIDEYVKSEIANIMKAKAYARSVIENVSPKRLSEIKSKLEGWRNNGLHYDFTNYEIKDMVKTIFGEELPMSQEYNVQMIDFIDAVDERMQEQSKSPQSKVGIIDKIKNFFKRLKSGKDTKALPEGKE